MSHSFIHSFIQLIENTPPLSPLELHTLAVAYEKQKPGSGMGNHLAFIALNAIYTNPSIQQVLSNPSPDFAIDPCGPLCALGAGGVAHCKCPPVKTNDEVKRVRHADLELLIE